MKQINIPYSDFSFLAIIKPAEEGGYYAYCPLLPGCVSQGETYPETVKNIEDAIKGYIETMIECGDLLPWETKTPNYIVNIPVSLSKKLLDECCD